MNMVEGLSMQDSRHVWEGEEQKLGRGMLKRHVKDTDIR